MFPLRKNCAPCYLRVCHHSPAPRAQGEHVKLRWQSRAIAVLACLGASCGGMDPPLDELPLRDALSAQPEVIAALPPEARRRLAGRLEAARASSEGTLLPAPPAAPAHAT